MATKKKAASKTVGNLTAEVEQMQEPIGSPEFKPIQKSIPAKKFGPWFRCPRCQGRSIVFNKREGRYDCRRCGLSFVVDWEHMICYDPEPEGDAA